MSIFISHFKIESNNLFYFVSQIRMWSWMCSMATSVLPKRKRMWRNARSIQSLTNPSSMTCRLSCCQTSLLSSWSWTLIALLKTRPWDAWYSAQTAPAPREPPTGRRSAKIHGAKSQSGTRSMNIRASPQALSTHKLKHRHTGNI